MSKWRKLQKGLMLAAIQNQKSNIFEENISRGRVHGTIYVRKDLRPKRGVLIAPGISMNRYGMQVLAQRLAAYGFFCLSIDAPSHYLNKAAFSLGESSETILEAISLLKNQYGMSRVGVVTYSLSAVGALFASVGYTTEIERRIYPLWEQLTEAIEISTKYLSAGEYGKSSLHLLEIDNLYAQMKNLIFLSLKQQITLHADASAYVFLAPPRNCKKAIPGIGLLRRLPNRWTKKVIETILHKPIVREVEKAGNPVHYQPEQDTEYVNWLFLKTKDIHGFLGYLVTMKEPEDFLGLIENMISLKHKDNKVSFFEYYQKKYILSRPKLFIYGRTDMLLRPFGFERHRLEKFYKSCGNSEIISGNFNHFMMKNPKSPPILLIDLDEVSKDIIRFLDKYV